MIFGGGYNLPYHIQAYFLMIRQEMLKSDYFWDFWERLDNIDSYDSAVKKFEIAFTNYFLSSGFVCDTLIKSEKDINSSDFFVDLMDRPSLLILDKQLPVLKKKLFTEEGLIDLTKESMKFYALNMFIFMQEKYEYELKYIVDYVNRVKKIDIDFGKEIEYMKCNRMKMKKLKCWNYRFVSKDVYTFLKENSQIWIYGAGEWTQIVINVLNEMNVTFIKGIIVTDKVNNPQFLLGIPVYEMDDIVVDCENISVLIAVKENKCIIKKLLDNGIKNYIEIRM